MQCPFCKHAESKVVDSRLGPEGDQIRRRRECESCHQRFTTYEQYEDVMPMVVKKDGRRVNFDPVKILLGVQKACEKRPVTSDQMSALVDRVGGRLRDLEDKELPASLIGEVVMEELKTLDDVAYVRFASVYRSFRDVNEFLEEIQGLVKKKT